MRGRASSRKSRGLVTVVAVARTARMARLNLGGEDPELCIAAGLSPLSTCTITDADSATKKIGCLRRPYVAESVYNSHSELYQHTRSSNIGYFIT